MPTRSAALATMIGLTLLTLGCGSQSGTKSGSSGAASVGAPAGKVSGIAYTVTSARAVTKIGSASDGITKSKQGKFVLVELALTNTTKRTYTFAAPETVWITTKNAKRYDPATEIGTSLGDDDLFSAQLAPGEKRKGKLAFDLPAAELSGAILHIEEESSTTRTSSRSIWACRADRWPLPGGSPSGVEALMGHRPVARPR